MHRRTEAGFSFIEIMVVMGIITVLVSMVVVVIPRIQEKANQTKSLDNLRSITLIMSSEGPQVSNWPPANGKSFTLWPVATNKIDKRNLKNLEILFSPGDNHFGAEKLVAADWNEVMKNALRDGTQDFSKFTSYAGRRNNEREHKLSADQLSKGTMVMSDDDQGPLHHSGGICVAWSNNRVDFMDWDDLEIPPPENKDMPEGLLGDSAANDELKHLSSGN